MNKYLFSDFETEKEKGRKESKKKNLRSKEKKFIQSNWTKKYV